MSKSPARGRSAKKGGALLKGGSQSPPPRTSRSVSPAGTVSGNNVLIDKDILEMLMKANLKDDDKDYKSIKIPLFSDGTEWEEVVFELEVNLERIWKYQSELDIIDYLNGVKFYCDKKYVLKADKMIYYMIVTAAKRDSFARKQIMAARHVDAVPRVEQNEGLKLFNMFQTTFMTKTKHQANLPTAQAEFYSMKMTAKESAKQYIARVDSAVSNLSLLNEKVSVKSWLFILANGLRAEFAVNKKGVLFSEPGFDNIVDLKASIMKEETIIGISKPTKSPTEMETANAVFEGTCNFCSKKGHKKQDCFAFKKQQQKTDGNNNGKQEKEKPGNKYWCDHCQKMGHTTDWCFWKPENASSSKGKPKGKGSKGKGKGKGSKGKSKGKGRANGNFPASYDQENAHYVTNWDTSSQDWSEISQESSSTDWQDYNLSIFECNEPEPILILYGTDLCLGAWTHTNAWTEQDFEIRTWGDHPTLKAKGGPECDFLFNVWTPNSKGNEKSIEQQRQEKLVELRKRKANGDNGLWMYLDSGASRSVIQEDSPIRKHLLNVSETTGSCNVGNGASLKYIEKGTITTENEVTVVADLKYDLYAAVAAAKRGVTCVIDFENGKNQSYLYCKNSGSVTPLIERKKGILEVPVHLYVNESNDIGLMAKQVKSKPSMSKISKFWLGMDQGTFDPVERNNNKDDTSLFTFDIIHSLSEKQKDFLIHARLAHLPRKAILQMVKNGAKGLPYSGHFKELCRPCLEARQRAENHGKEHVRHPDGKIGEHLHSDLAVVNLPDYSGFKYVLTVVDEISDEVVVTLLQTKDSKTVLAACKKTLQLISARTQKKLKTWQFDRGGEFLNEIFEEWILRELGAQQLFSNIEHPWENGRAERSFSTIFEKARAMLKYADLPNGLWGKAVAHAVYLKNRCPSSRLNLMAPLQFRTGNKMDFTRMRVFGCPAQIFIRQKERLNNKLAARSEKGTFIGMSKLGNGFLFRVQRTKQYVEVDSADAKFNETFSDCRDKKGKIVKNGRVLDPDLIDVPDLETNLTKANETKNNVKENSRFTTRNYYDLLDDESEHEETDRIENEDDENDENDKDEETKTDESETREKVQPTRTEIFEPIKTSRETKKLKSTNEFVSSPIKGRRAPKPRDKFEPDFEPTYKRKEKTLMMKEQAEDIMDLDYEDNNYGELLTCMEQNLKEESGKLQNDVEDEIKRNLLDIGSPDPKSQAAINLMPEQKRKRYNEATTKEFEGMKRKKVMEYKRITDLPKGTKIYICIVNWVTKYVLGVYQKTKCRICFGGHHYVKTFTDCFAPTVNFCSVLVMLCLAAMFGWFLGSLDYSQAYLNADIDEECYLRAPEYLREYDVDGTEFVWKLKKVIYGHPKGSRLWAACLDKKLKELGYKQLQTDQCVYAKWTNWDLQNLGKDSHFTFIMVHSDDLIIISNKKSIMQKEKLILLTAFEGVDQGNLTSFCGVEVDISDEKIVLSMEYYWKRIMKRFGISEHDKQDKPIKTKVNRMDCPKQANPERKKTYLQIIGSIIFGYTHCRLDLALPVGMLTRVMHSPSEGHLKQLYGLLRYLNATKEWGLQFFRDHTMEYGMKFTFLAYCDSSHADDEGTYRSTGGWFFFLRPGQGCVSAKSGQTPDVALSSTEAETIWACNACTQGAYIKQFLDELRIFGETTFDLMEDSQPAINAQRKNVSSSKFRHIKIKYHYIRQLILDGWCKLVKIDTKAQVADIATKILPTNTIHYFSNVILGNTVDLSSVTDFDQSLYVMPNYSTLLYNDWGVVSEPLFYDMNFHLNTDCDSTKC